MEINGQEEENWASFHGRSCVYFSWRIEDTAHIQERKGLFNFILSTERICSFIESDTNYLIASKNNSFLFNA